jgi:2-haloacid dehalogenase
MARMPIRWVLFDLNGTLVDPSVLAQPLGDSAGAEDLVAGAFDLAVMQAMAATLSGDVEPFVTYVDAALRRSLALAGLGTALADDALALLGSMPAFIEAPAALERLRGEGLRLGVLTQSGREAAEQVLRFAGLRDRIDVVVGADSVGAFKPDPRMYAAGVEATGVQPGEICHVATHWWDMLGASRAGMCTGWVARRERALLASVPEPTVRGNDLSEVAERIVAELL